MNTQQPVYDIANARSCQDCVLIMTNDDHSHMSEAEWLAWLGRRATARIGMEAWEWSGVQCDSMDEYGDACDCDGGSEEHVTEGWFSWSPCEWCGDTHGGQRFNVAIMRRIA